MEHLRCELVDPGYDYLASLSTLQAAQRSSASPVEATWTPWGREEAGKQFIVIYDPILGPIGIRTKHRMREDPHSNLWRGGGGGGGRHFVRIWDPILGPTFTLSKQLRL